MSSFFFIMDFIGVHILWLIDGDPTNPVLLWVLYLLPGLHLYLALPLAGLLYVAGLFALRTFSGPEVRQFWVAAREGLARLRGSDEAEAKSFDSR